MRTKAKSARPDVVKSAPRPAGLISTTAPRAEIANGLAARGIAGASAQLPHLEQIQRAFGAYDVRHVRAAVGGDAAAASAGLGARAYAVGDRVAFRREPDLHLAAHEAAHVIQQRAGVSLDTGGPRGGDAAEQHADAVADAVVAGRSVEDMLARAPSGRGVQRSPETEDRAALATTPGGNRLGELDELTVQDTFNKILPLLSQSTLFALDREYETSQARAIAPTERLYGSNVEYRIRDTVREIDGAPPDARQATRDAYYHDIGVVIARAFQSAPLDVATIAATVDTLSFTYLQLVRLHSTDRISFPRPLPAEAAPFDADFTARADLLLRFATEHLARSPDQLRRVKQGMAADIGRLVAADFQSHAVKVLAPDRAAEWLVYELLGSPPRLAELRLVFAAVARDVNAKQQLYRLVYLVSDQYFEELVGKPVALVLGGAKDGPTRERLRRELALPLGRYLARVGGKEGFLAIQMFAYAMRDSYGATFPSDVEAQLRRADEEYFTPATTTTPAKPVVTSTADPHRCVATYSFSDVQAYFAEHTGIHRDKSKHAPKWDPELVFCQFRGGTHTPAVIAVTRAHLAEWLASMDAEADDLRKQYEQAVIRDREIGKARTTIAKTKDPDSFEPPDLVGDLTYATKYWYELYQVPSDRALRLDGIERELDALALKYFFALQRYQETLQAALSVVVATESAQLDAFLRLRYPNDLARRFADFRENALVEQRWPRLGDKELRDSEGFAIQIEQMKLALAAAAADRDAEHRAELEEEIYRQIDGAVRRIRRDHGDTDQITTDQVWDDLKMWLHTMRPGEEGLAKELITTALGDVHFARYAELMGQAQKALVGDKVVDKAGKVTEVIPGRDTGTAAKLLERMERLKQFIAMPMNAAPVESLKAMVRGESMNLIGVWMMVENSWVASDGAMRIDAAGDVIRAGNLLRYAMEEGHVSTIAAAYEWIEHNDVLIAGLSGDKLAAVLKDSNKGMVDWLKIHTNPSSISVAYNAKMTLERSRNDRALKYVIDAENAGSGEKRNEALAEMARVLGEKSASHNKAVAQYVYSYLLGAAEELQDAEVTAKQEIAAAKDAAKQLADRKANPPKVKTTEMVKEEAAWRATVKKVADARTRFRISALPKSDPAQDPLESDAKAVSASTVASFDKFWHPIQNRDMTTPERLWWREYKRLGSFSEKGWAELKEFGEGVLLTLVVGYVTGGLGEIALGGIEAAASTELLVGSSRLLPNGLSVGSVVSGGIKLAEIGAFTETMRIIQEMQAGQGSEAPFWEELVVNLAMAGASKFAAMRTGRALEGAGIRLDSMRGKLSLFAAEYIATSGVGLAHLYIGAAVRGDLVSGADVKQNLFSNFAFLVGMKASHAFVELPKHAFKNEAKTWRDPAIAAKYEELTKRLEPLDQKFQKLIPEILRAETAAERKELLDAQADILENKAKQIEQSGIPDAAKVAKSFRAGVDMFRADAKRATTLEQIGAKGEGDTPHLSYERGGENEAALESMLKDSESNFKIIERADGSKVFLVYTSEGFIRYEPREPGTGASQKEAYSKTTRIKGEKIPGKTKGSKEKIETAADVALILNAAAARSNLIPSYSGDSFSIAGVKCKVKIVVKDKLNSNADHDSGPATYKLKMDKNGEWVAEVTVRKSAPNDHVVRGVNHEITELAELIARLDAHANKVGGRDAYKKDATLQKAMKTEISEMGLKDPKATSLSSHDLANVNADVATLEKQIAEAQAAVERLPPGADRRAAERRLEMLEADVGAIMDLLDLPSNEKQFQQRLEALEKLGVEPAAIRTLQQLWTAQSTKFRFGMSELQIVFAQLKIANPDRVSEGSFLGMKLYYEEKVRGRVEEAVKAARKKGKSEQEVRQIAIDEAERMLGGTSIASWRGRAFEGLLIDSFNADPQLVAQYGRMYQITQNNFPTYDIVGIKFSTGAGGVSAKGVATPLQFGLVTQKVKGQDVRLLVVKDALGKIVAEQHPDGTMTSRPGIEVWLSSLKAKDNASITEMKKALGTPEKPTGQFMHVTPEYIESLDEKIDNARKDVAAKKMTGDKKAVREASRRLDLLEFFKQNIRLDSELSNAKIDSLLRTLKGQGIDTDAIAAEAIKKKKKKGS